MGLTTLAFIFYLDFRVNFVFFQFFAPRIPNLGACYEHWSIVALSCSLFPTLYYMMIRIKLILSVYKLHFMDSIFIHEVPAQHVF